MPIEGGEPRLLLADAPGLAFTPAFSPDGRLIAYSRWKPGGFRDIHLYDLATGTDRALAVDRAMDLDPRFSPDGRYVLYSSDRSGINNIYAYELSTRRLFQVTNVLSGAFQPAVSPDGHRLVYTGFTTDGFDLWTMPYNPATFQPAKPFANARLDSPSDPDAETDSPDAAPEDAAAAPFPERVVPYVPWKYMYPHQWTVGVLQDPFGLGDTFQLQTSVTDPASIHFFSFNFLFPRSGSPSGVIGYTYARFWPAFNLALSKVDQVTNGLIIDNQNLNYVQRTITFSASTDLPVLQTPDASATVSFGYDYAAYGPISRSQFPVGEPTGGITVLPQTGPAADLTFSWRFSNAHQWQYSISNQEGRSVGVTLRLVDPALGGTLRSTSIQGSWAEYLTPPWARLHALALLAEGGFSLGDQRQFFSLGGYGYQDVLRSVLLKQQSFAFLRGYPVNVVSGDSFVVASGEYRAPLLWIERGYQTFPLYLRRIWGAGFVDAGNAFQGPFHAGDLKTDAGVETHLLFSVGWYLEAQIHARLCARIPVRRRQPALLRRLGDVLTSKRLAPDDCVDAGGENGRHLVDLGLGHGQRREEVHRVAERPQQGAAADRLAVDRVAGTLLRIARASVGRADIDRGHHPARPHVAKRRATGGDRLQRGPEPRGHRRHPPQQIVLGEHVEHGVGDGDAQRVAGVGVRVEKGAPRRMVGVEQIVNGIGCEDRRQWQDAAREPLGERREVGEQAGTREVARQHRAQASHP